MKSNNLSLPRHLMREAQVTLSLKGKIAEPACWISGRAGRADYREGRTGNRQDSRSEETPRALLAAAGRLKKHILQKMRPFTEHDGQLKVQGLLRRRTVAGIADYTQRYDGFWGTLDVPGHWPSIFGGNEEGDLVFRRGPWEEWPRGLPEFERLDNRLPLILSPYCATLFHEAVGHTLEAEYLASSPLKYYHGETVSHRQLTVMDRPDLEGYAGSMSHDDSGQPASQTTLIQNGILIGDLGPKKGAVRRASYRELPLIRATNFTIRAGEAKPEGWISNIPRCYYVTWIQSGHWQPGASTFRIMTGPVFLLEKGSPVACREWVSLNPSIRNFLGAIRAIGDDLSMDPVVHWCLKQHQSVPMSMGSPSILLEGYNP